MTWGMAEMIKNPTVMKKAQAEVREVFNAKERIDETAVNEMHKYFKKAKRSTKFYKNMILAFAEAITFKNGIARAGMLNRSIALAISKVAIANQKNEIEEYNEEDIEYPY